MWYGLIKYNNSYLKKTAQKFNCLLRKISLEDSLLYGGSSGLNSQNSININFSGNIPITIEYAAPTFIDEEKTVYSFRECDHTWISFLEHSYLQLSEFLCCQIKLVSFLYFTIFGSTLQQTQELFVASRLPAKYCKTKP